MLRADLSVLTEREFDVVIIGGGITGACIAWDATLRGLSVALLEADDFGGGASANSLKIVHGGIRYLQHLDLPRLRASVVERSILLRIAPHLVEPLPFAIPTYGTSRFERAVLRAGLRTYDLLTAGRNRGIEDPTRRVPNGRMLSGGEARALLPEVDHRELTGAAVFHDGLIYNPPRLTLEFIRAAAERGAGVANYVEVTRLSRDRDRVTGVRATCRSTGDAVDVRGRMVVNATGGWTPGLLGPEDLGADEPPTFSRDACFILRRRLSGGHAIALLTGTRDPDAVVSRGARHLFLVPWRDSTLVGVWHRVFREDPSSTGVSDDELDAFLSEVNDLGLSFEATRDEVSQTCGGLVLFESRQPGGSSLRYGKRSLVIDHEERDGVPGLMTAIAVRYTVGRRVAERAVDRIVSRLGRPSDRCRTAEAELPGGGIHMDELRGDIRGGAGDRLAPRALEALARNHGARWRQAVEPAASDPTLWRTLGDSTVTGAEVVHAARDEWVVRLADVVLRRTDLGSAGHPGSAALGKAADLVGAELGWSPDRVRDELESVERRYPDRAADAA